MNFNFIKINKEQFTVNHNDYLNILVKETLDKLSLGITDKFQSIINNSLEDQLVSRIITSEFDKQFPDHFSNNNMFIRINAMYNNRKVIITMGKVLDDGNNKILNGVLYP